MVLLTSIWQNMPYLNDIGILKFLCFAHQMEEWEAQERRKVQGRDQEKTL